MIRLSAAAAALPLVVAASSAHANWITSNLDTDTDFINARDSEGLTEVWVAEGRIADNLATGDHEADLGPDTGAPADDHDFIWGNNQAIPFTLTYDAGTNTLEYAIGGGLMSYQPTDAANEMFIRVRATNNFPSMSVELTDLIIDGKPVGSDIATNNTSADGVEYLRISGGALESGFSMTGNAKLVWDDSDAPRGSHLAFQIKGTIPTPGSVAVASLGGLALLRRRRSA